MSGDARRITRIAANVCRDELLLNATAPVRHRKFGLPTEARWQSLRLHVVNWQPFAVANCTQTMSTFMFVYTLNTSLSIAQLASGYARMAQSLGQFLINSVALRRISLRGLPLRQDFEM